MKLFKLASLVNLSLVESEIKYFKRNFFFAQSPAFHWIPLRLVNNDYKFAKQVVIVNEILSQQSFSL